MGSTRQHAHELIDRLPPSQMSEVVGLLEAVLDPVTRSLAEAAVEREPISAEEASALDEGRASLDRGEGIDHEDILREFGLSTQ